ncbi:Gfo/Idh/MocA family protein [Phormidium sp. CCY1219]|uniref:Gfo/Idh/MocA family protein n=1 Tax=Phormidium sp. CCY1219 TaxID=2886104 RepID=UPI002D1EE3E6|nr:Gfo/Idh/MocA family oxidoreductase [Phormidium sp. CCY1219]MEB3828114.1 Gfo/Idh/MocA family oxidoreductase [Phormidium sp. CCY1219]
MKNICLVGCGAIARLHAKNLSPFAHLYFHSRSPQSADTFNRQFQGQGVMKSWADVIENTQIDAVVITSPPEFHAQQIIGALSAGKSVLVEKPMCISAAEVDSIEKALNNTAESVFLMVAENYYYKPSLRQIKELLSAEYLGEIKSVVVQKLSWQEASGWKRQYGALLEGGIHFVALISDIFDAVPARVEAEFTDKKEGGPERFSKLRITYGNEKSAQLIYGWNRKTIGKGLFQRSRIVGERGKIIFESNGIYVLIAAKSKTALYLPNWGDLMGYGAMTEDFLRALGDKNPVPYSDFAKAKRDLGIVFAAYERGGK